MKYSGFMSRRRRNERPSEKVSKGAMRGCTVVCDEAQGQLLIILNQKRTGLGNACLRTGRMDRRLKMGRMGRRTGLAL